MKFYSLPLLTLLASVCLTLPVWAQQATPPPGIDLPTGARTSPQVRPVRQATVASERRATLSTMPAQRTALSACNLVKNPTFDDQLVTPSGIHSNVPGSPYTRDNVLATWRCTEAGTADHYATNAPAGTSCHPASSVWGNFTPHNNGPSSVNGCAGICTHSDYIDSNNNPQVYREYITQKLRQPLQRFKTYYVSFWVRLAPVSQYATTLTLNFTDTDPTAPFGVTQAYTPSQYSITTPLLDQYTWTRVTGIIDLAQGDRVVPDLQYLNIGGMESGYQQVSPSPTTTPAYYYIDDVEIYELPVAPIPGNTYLCTGTGGADIGYGCEDIPGATYTWKVRRFDGLRVTSGFPPNPSGLFNHVTPTEPTIYTLDVLLPDGNTWTSGLTIYPQDWLGITAQGNGSFSTIPDGGTVCNGRLIRLDVWYNVATGPFIWKVDGVPMPRGWNVTYLGPDYEFTTSQYDFVYIRPLSKRFRYFTVTCEGTGSCQGGPVTADYSFYYDPRSFCREAQVAGEMPTAAVEQEAVAQAHPNPVADYLTLPAGVQQAELRDAMGQPLLQQAVSGQTLDVHALPEGIYQLRLMQEGKTQTQRIVIKH
ncbi:MAG: T9SS type A sorting domain-containing protein [Hymenobacter sp.]|nr:MAG: T9SS type A sorting domain-containing protein [Hymenobacter sp.]